MTERENEAPAEGGEKEEPFNPRDPKHYKFWKRAHAAKQSGEKFSTPVDDPQCGFYKMRTEKGGPFRPVAIWYNSKGTMVAKIEGNEANPLDIWNGCGSRPIGQKLYREVIEVGVWPEVQEVKSEQVQESTAEPGPGHNIPPEDSDTLANAAVLLDEARSFVKDNAEITDMAVADRADLFIKKMRSAKSTADKKRLAETKPHRDMVEEINGAWKPTIEKLDLGIRSILKLVEVFMKKQKAAAQETVDKVKEETGMDVEVSTPKVGEENVIDGKKRSTHLQKVYVAKVVDAPKAAAHFANNPKIMEVVKALAIQEFTTTKANPPGVEVSQDEVAR